MPKPSFCGNCIRETEHLSPADYMGRTVYLCRDCSGGYYDPRQGREFAVVTCSNGHVFTEDNTYWRNGRYRVCRTCHRERERERWRQKRARNSTPHQPGEGV